MTDYNIVMNGVTIAKLSCSGLLFDLNYPEEHEIPDGNGRIAVRIALAPGVTVEEAVESST